MAVEGVSNEISGYDDVAQSCTEASSCGAQAPDESSSVDTQWRVDGSSDPTLNTIVTDGKGGIKVQIGTPNSSVDRVIRRGITVHENVHKSQALQSPDLTFLEGQPEGLLVKFPRGVTQDQVNQYERAGYQAERRYLRRQIQRGRLSNKALVQAHYRIKQIENYVNANYQ